MEELKDPLLYIPKFLKVLTKADEHNLSDLVPMKLWRIQEHFLKHKTKRNIAVKPRQVGFSTIVLADNSHALFTQPYHRMTVIAQDEETAEFLLSTIHRFYNNLPEGLRPSADLQAAHRLKLGNMDSYIYIDSARSDSIGIGHGLTRVHLSEVSRWPEKKAVQLFADISQTVPAGGEITIEAKPQGRAGLFFRLYGAAKRGEINYTPFFYPWWWDEGYKRPRPVKGLFIATPEEQQLINNFQLIPEQIMFRREKISELGDLFYQEYPENDVDCWLSNDMSVFDGASIRKYMQEIQSGKAEGSLTIWKDAIGGEKYVIGVDMAGGHEKGDWSVASVLRCRNNEYVARLRAKEPPDLFAQELLRLGARYDAEIGVEREGHGHTVLHILLENNYSKIYYHQDYDSFTGNMVSDPGWKTSGKTKPIMIDTMVAALRSGDLVSYSENFLVEASGYMWDEKKTKKQPGGYDDELDALMIALQMREISPIISEKRYTPISYARL
mgnify:CR=1 FL=1